jgi:hypothetical protein
VTLPYFPFAGGAYQLAMGTRFLSPDRLIEVDERYRDEVALRGAILAADEGYAYQAPPGTEAIAWETVVHLLPNMARHHPEHFALTVSDERWRWTNRLLGEEITFTPGDPAGLPRPPLDWLGRQVQEDLLLLDGEAAGTPLVAGHLCFPAGWRLSDKLGQSFLAIHDPVPDFRERIGRPADLLMQRIKPGHPSVRVNWTLELDDHLDHSPRAVARRGSSSPFITAANAGQRVYLRLERQTLSRLPSTRAVLFTIRTYISPLAAELTDLDRLERFAAAIRTLPRQMSVYKGIAGYAPALLAYLDERRRELTVAAD